MHDGSLHRFLEAEVEDIRSFCHAQLDGAYTCQHETCRECPTANEVVNRWIAKGRALKFRRDYYKREQQ